MKRIIIIAMISISVILFAVSGYFIYKSYLQNRNPVDVVKEFTGDVKERREYMFQAPKVTKATETVNGDSNPRYIQLYLGNGKYYTVNVPANDTILTDYSTYVYNVDNSYSIQVLKGVTKNNMESIFNISNSEKLTHTIIKTKDGKKEPQSIGVLLVDDIGVTATCYDNPIAFATIYSGITKNRISNDSYVKPEKAVDCVDYTNASQIPNNDIFPFSINPNNFNEAGTKQYNFEDGQLTQFSIMKGYNDSINEMLTRINVAKFGEAKINGICQTEGTRYMELGDFTVLIISNTINKSSCLLGQGKEARYNIITYYRQYGK